MKRKLLITLALVSLLFAFGFTFQGKPSPFVVGRTYGVDDKNNFTVLEDRGNGWLKVRAKWPMGGKETEYLLNTNQIPMLLEK
jgi:hypothetical protein